MSVLDKLQIIAPDGKIDFYDLDPRKGLITLGQPAGYDPSLGIPQAVPFQILINLQKKPFQVKVQSARTPAMLNSQILSTNRFYDLVEGSSLDVDGYILVFLENIDIPAPAYAGPGQPQPQPQVQPQIQPQTQPRPVETQPMQAQGSGGAMNLLDFGLSEDADPNLRPPDIRDDNIIANISANFWTVDVENAATCEVEIRNGFKETSSFEVHVEGRGSDIEDWSINISPRVVNLNSGDTKTVKVAITPPRQPTSSAGPHPIAFVITSPESPRNRRQLGAMVVIKPYYQFNVDRLRPIHETGRWLSKDRKASFYINNQGNSTAKFLIQSTDDESGALIKFPGEAGKPPVQLREIEVQARSQPYPVPLLISPQHRPPLIGAREKQYKYTVSTVSQDNPAVSQPLSGTYTSVPILGRLFILAVALIAVVCILITGFVILQPRIDDFRVANPVVRQGESANLTWQVSPFTTNVKIDGLADPITGSQGQVAVVPETSASTYTLIAGNWLSRMLRLEDLRSQPVNVLSIPAYPDIVTLSVDRSVVFQSDEITVKWSVKNADEAALTVEGVTTTLKGDQLNGEQKYQLKGDTLVVLTAKNNSGAITRSEYVRARPIKITINAFTVSAKDIVKGSPVTISWDVAGEGLQSVTISPFKDPLPFTGSLQFFPQASTEFVLTAKARDQQEIRLLSVGVQDKVDAKAPVVDIFKAAPELLPVGGGSVEFSWSVSGQTTNVQITGKDGILANKLPAQGFQTFNVSTTANFLMIAYNGTLSNSKDAKVTVPSLKNVILTVDKVEPHDENSIIRKNSFVDVYVKISPNSTAIGLPPITGTVIVGDGLNDCEITAIEKSFHCQIKINQFPPLYLPTNATGAKITRYTAKYLGDTNYSQADTTKDNLCFYNTDNTSTADCASDTPDSNITESSKVKPYKYLPKYFIYQTNSVIFKATYTPDPTVTTLYTGQPFTLSLDVSPADPLATSPITGSVEVKQGTHSFCTISLSNSSSDPLTGSGNCSVHDPLPYPGDSADRDIPLTLFYSGDGNYKNDQDSSTIHITKALTQITFALPFPPATSMYKETVTISFTVAVQAGKGSGIPTGTVRVQDKDDPTNYCDRTLVVADNGSGSCGFTLRNLGARKLILSYISADGRFANIDPSPAPAIDLTVNQADTTTVITSVTPVTTWEVGQRATVNFSVSANNTAHTLPSSGSVQVTTVGSATPDCQGAIIDGIGVCTLTISKSGSIHFTAKYLGDQNPPVFFKASLDSNQYPGGSDPVITVIQAQSKTNILSVNPSSPGDPGNVIVQYEVKAFRTDSFLQPSSGTVTVQANGITICAKSYPAADNSCTVNLTTIGLNHIDVSYGGALDASFASSVVPTLDYIVRQPTTIAVSTASGPVYIDNSVSFNVTLTPTGSYGPVTGTITVIAETGDKCSDITLSPPTLTYACAITFSTAGSHTVTATYHPSASSNYTGATGNTGYTVQKDTPTISSFSHSPSTSLVGQGVLVSYTITPQFTSTPPTPTGVVTVTTNGSETCQSTLNTSTGAGSCTLTFTHGGTRTITVSYDGSTSNRFNSVAVTYSGLDAQTVNPANTSTSLSSLPATFGVGQAVNFTATVTAIAPGGGTPSGTVTFTAVRGGSPTQTCLNVSLSGGQATCAITFPTSGSWTVTAQYTPASGADYNSSNATNTPTVQAANTTTELGAAPAPSTPGTSVTFTATVHTNPVSAIIPSGNVNFKATLGATTLTCSSIPLASGQALCTLALPTVGSWAVTADYIPSTDFNASSGNLSQTVSIINTSITVTSDTAPSAVGQLVTLTATVNPIPLSASTPEGKVTFTVTHSSPSATMTCTDVTLSAGAADCALTYTHTGTWQVAVAYTPSSTNFNSSTGSGSQVVNKVPTTLSLTPTPGSLTWHADQTQLFDFTLGYSSGLTPTGTLSLTATGPGTTSTCSKTLPATTGCPITINRSGTWTVTGTYAGDSNFANSSTGPLSITASLNTPTVTLVTLVQNGNDLDVSVTVSGATPNSTSPSGNITVSVRTTSKTKNCNVTAGTIVCTLSQVYGGGGKLPDGSYFVDVVYNGDNYFTTVTVLAPATNLTVP